MAGSRKGCFLALEEWYLNKFQGAKNAAKECTINGLRGVEKGTMFKIVMKQSREGNRFH